MTSASREALDPGPLARWLVGLAYAEVAALIAFMALLFADAASPAGDWMERAWPPWASSVMIFGYLAMFLATSVLALMWIYRVNANAQTIAPDMDSSPGWSVAWYFIPIANLWKPFRGLKEAWLVSHDPKGWRYEDTPAILRWWWGLWLAGNFTSNFSAPHLDWSSRLYLFVLAVRIIDILVSIAQLLVFIEVVQRLTAAQTATLKSADDAERKIADH